ncbi:YrhB domain-containing protein [Nocardia sp. NPDC024068]|uniref:YrhB domain-containing protein n=1 Tax=Nocardia sp. NPDC024068 TaxID=3157197 RepID=UPI0033E4344E
MVSKEWAVTIVERYLAEQAVEPGAPTLVVTDVRPHRLGWVVISQGERYLRTRKVSDMLVGLGYLLVDGVDGSMHSVHAAVDLEHGAWIEHYLEQVRGVEPASPLRARVAELLERGQRLDALRVVRAAAPELGLHGTKEYIEAVAAGMPAPEHVCAYLPRPAAGLRSRRALSGPNPEPVE